MCSGVGHTHCFLHIEEENYRYKVANGGDVYHQMPHKVVVLKSLLCVEPCADCVEYSAGGNEYKQREGGVSQKEREEELLKALNTLKPQDKLIFYRKYYYMQSTEQIAVELGTTIRAIEGKLYRIKRQLRKTLGGDFYER